MIGPGTKVRPESMCEGPSLLKTKEGWDLYWDSPLIKTYAMASSTDLINWTDHTAELQLPEHPRHGTVFRAPRSAVGWLQKSDNPASAGDAPGCSASIAESKQTGWTADNGNGTFTNPLF